MPFGLTNAPATFQREMNRILMPLIGKCLFVYIDDILVYSPMFEQHIMDLRNLFLLLRQAHLFVNIDKCKFCSKSVEVLRHILSSEGLKPVPDKIQAIKSWKPPANVNQLRSFLGLVSYYRKFIPNLASLSDNLYKLNSPKSSFICTIEHNENFLKLKNALCFNPIISYPNCKNPFIIRTNASAYAIGVVLLQIPANSNYKK